VQSPIFQSFFQDRGRGGNTDQCINLYLEIDDGGEGVLISVPGKQLLFSVGTGPIRGTFVANNGLMYVVSGNQLFSVTSLYATTLIGTIGSNNGPVSFANSPTQLLVVDGTGGWVWDYSTSITANVTTAVASPGVVGWTGHPFVAGSPVTFGTNGALPTGLVAGTVYYVLAAGLTANAFEVAATVQGAAINFTGSTSGQSTAANSGQTFRQVIPNVYTNCVNPSVVIYQDGFALVNDDTTNQIYQSNYNDLSMFASGVGPVANFAYVQQNSKPIVTLYDLKEEVWIFKDKSAEVWINQGAAGFAFTPLQGVSIPVGCTAPASIAQLGESIVWLGGSEQGFGVVYISQGYNVKPITTYALSSLFQGFAVISDAIGWGYQDDGHYFYVLTFPTQGATYCYDLVTQKWHQRACLNNGVLTRDWANCFATFNGVNIVGDFQSPNLYSLSHTLYTDNGQARKWLRSWRALPSGIPQGVPMSFDSLQILMETGITVPAGTNPQMMLRWSDDGGNTWSNSVQVPMGQTGQTSWRVIQNRLGATTIRGGLDRIFEISGIDPILIKVIGAEIEAGLQ